MNRLDNLAERTSSFSDATETFRRTGEAAITVGHLRRARTGGRLRSLDGRSVAIGFADDLIAGTAIALLDGAVPRMLLLPPGLDSGESQRQMDVAGAVSMVTDGAIARAPGAVETIAVTSVANILEPGPRPSEPDRQYTTEWLIPTSGTTGVPRVVVHSLGTLARTTRPPAGNQIGMVWGLAYGLTRFAGLQILLQSLISGSPLVVPAAGTDLGARIDAFVDQGVNALSATPSMWRRILMSPAAADLNLRQITLGGEIADDAILGALARQWPAARLTHIYASTEAGVGFSVKDGRAGFPFAWLADPPEGVELAVSPNGVLRIRPTVGGQRLLDGPRLFGDDGFVDTGDLVRREGDRYLFLGRQNGAINVGGNKVQPEEVERVLLTCPGVRLASVRGRPNPITGMVIEAAIVQDPSLPTDLDRRKAIGSFCRARLPGYAVPSLIRFVAEIELNEAGKTVRTGATA